MAVLCFLAVTAEIAFSSKSAFWDNISAHIYVVNAAGIYFETPRAREHFYEHNNKYLLLIVI